MSRSKRLFGGANATPLAGRHLNGGRSSPQAHLVQSLVFLLLVPDALSNHRFIPAHRGHEESSCPEVLAHKIPPPLSEDPRQAHGAIHCPCRSPAIQIFIRPDDVILRINERVVKSAEGIDSAVTASASGVVKVTGLTQTVIVVVQFEREVKCSRLRQ